MKTTKLDFISDDLRGTTSPKGYVYLSSLSDETSIFIDRIELAAVIAYLRAALDASETSYQE